MINRALDLRNKVAHSGIIPTAIYKFLPGSGKYDFEKSINSYEEDMTALDNLKLGIQDVTRYLLLKKMFNLNIFPKLKELKWETIGL